MIPVALPQAVPTCTELSAAVGADLAVADFRALLRDPWGILYLKAALARHLVLRIRGQDLGPAELCDLALQWGPLMDVRHAGNGALHVPGHDFIKVISNASDPRGRRLGDGDASAQIWHSDASSREAPPGVTLFYGKSTPVSRPRTYFMNMIRVYDALPRALQETIRPLRVRHHQYPRGVEVGAPTAQSLPLDRRLRGATHPLVRRHLATNQPLLYLPYRRDCIVDGMAEDDARDLLERLWRFTEAASFQHGVAIEPGDLVIWDNTAVLHRRDGWPATEPRVMWHVSAQGEIPTPMYPRHEPNENALGFDGQGDAAYIGSVQAVVH